MDKQSPLPSAEKEKGMGSIKFEGFGEKRESKTDCKFKKHKRGEGTEGEGLKRDDESGRWESFKYAEWKKYTRQRDLGGSMNGEKR